MQVVYEIVQDDMPLDLPLFTDLERARHELNLLVQVAHKDAQDKYHDAFVMAADQDQPEHVVEAHYVMVCEGQLEFVTFGLYCRQVNVGTMGESRS